LAEEEDGAGVDLYLFQLLREWWGNGEWNVVDAMVPTVRNVVAEGGRPINGMSTG